MYLLLTELRTIAGAFVDLVVIGAAGVVLVAILGDALVQNARDAGGLDPVRARVFHDYLDLMDLSMGYAPFSSPTLNMIVCKIVWVPRLFVSEKIAGPLLAVVRLTPVFDAHAWAKEHVGTESRTISLLATVFRRTNAIDGYSGSLGVLLDGVAPHFEGAASVIVTGPEAPAGDGPVPILALVVDEREVSRNLVDKLNAALEDHEENPRILPGGRRLVAIRLLSRAEVEDVS